MDIITKTISVLFADRIKKIDSFATRAVCIQEQQFLGVIKHAQNTEYGKKYHFGEIKDYNTFNERIPAVSYEELNHYIERMIQGEKDVLWRSAVKWYAKSSGTTNDRSKYIPVTKEILCNCHYKGGLDAILLYLRNNPQSRFFSKKGLVLGGSHKPAAINSKSHSGDLSAVLLQNTIPLVNLIRVPSKKIILMDEWEAKIKAIIENTVNEDVGSISGVPSWMLVLLKAILEKTGKKNISEVWTHLEVFFHGGVGFEPYRLQYESVIGSEKMRYMEIYNASEGFFGIQDDLTEKSMLLMLDYGIFYEFIPTNSDSQKIIPLEDVKVNENYEVIITTAGGLWRYRIGDTIRFTSVFPHKFIITGRTKQFINVFGEELMIDNSEKGIKKACEETNALVRSYSAAPLFRKNTGTGLHQWIIEFEKKPASLDDFALRLDNSLQQLNSDYEAKRYKNISLQRLEIIEARKDLFFDWLKIHGKLGGQHKIPCLSNDRKIIDELIELNNKPIN
ncbi:MAG: GH3 auxin-responsive promoter family protein [Tannerella sp.]|jgi:hypothetical protein|nr:GH3 auxin-responsive promoter family protein [Tannerella sp.]